MTGVASLLVNQQLPNFIFQELGAVVSECASVAEELIDCLRKITNFEREKIATGKASLQVAQCLQGSFGHPKRGKD